MIGNENKGVASSKNTITLISEEKFKNVLFNPDYNLNNRYKGSLLQNEVEKIADTFTAGEQAAIVKRTLTSGTYDDVNTDCVAGDPVDNARLWPLSTQEAYVMNLTLRKKVTTRWWLRSPGNYNHYAANVEHDGRVRPGGHRVDGYVEDGYGYVDIEYGARPAFHLNLSSVLFTSAVTGGKSGVTGTLMAVGNIPPEQNEWKVTLKDDGTIPGLDGHQRFTASLKSKSSVQTGNKVTISYDNAKSAANEYVSVILRDTSNNILYYGHLDHQSASSTGKELLIPASLPGGNYKLSVFAEQCNDGLHPDYASNVVDLGTLTVTASSTAIFDVTFDTQGHGMAPAPQIVADRSKVTEPTAPSEIGYFFCGWYKEAACVNAWNFNTDVVTGHTTLYAKWNKFELNDGAGIIQEDRINEGNAPIVYYAGKAWYVIGNANRGVASRANTITLISKDNLTNVQFNQAGNTNNHYSGSQLQSEVENIADTFAAGEQAAIVKRTLTSGIYNEKNTDCVAGAQVDGARLWPLSTREARETNATLREEKMSFFWWLRSPGESDNRAAVVVRQGTVFEYGNDVSSFAGVCPAFHLNLQSVLYTSAATGGKPGDAGLGILTAVAASDPDEWKVTLKDDGHAGFQATKMSFDGNTMKFSYSGAKTGDNEFVSAIVTDSKGLTGGTIKYYGHVAQNSAKGEATINLSGKVASGDKLFVFAEQCNGDYQTDYASSLVELSLAEPVMPATGVTLDQTIASLETGKTLQLTATVAPANATYKTVTWTSSNANVATVSTTGLVTAKAAGTAAITATTHNNKSISCTVTVTQSGGNGNGGNGNGSNGNGNGGNGNGNGGTGNGGNGNGIGNGNTVIDDPYDPGTPVSPVTPSGPVYVSSMKLNKKSAKLENGKTLSLKATVKLAKNTPAKQKKSMGKVVWTSTRSNVATVSSSGKVKAKGSGTTIITAWAKDGSGKSASCTVTVSSPVKKATISKKSVKLNLASNNSVTLNAGWNKGADVSTVKWSVKGKGASLVSQSGENNKTATISVSKAGKVTVTATVVGKNGKSKKVTCKITVTEPKKPKK